MDRRIPSLDGARTVSITLVVVWHIFNMTPILWRFDYGNLGVRTFFVISGFLITSLLMRELQKTGTIRLRTFYARRFMRLMPAYWFYVAIVAALIPTGLVDATWHKLIPALTYTANYCAAFPYACGCRPVADPVQISVRVRLRCSGVRVRAGVAARISVGIAALPPSHALSLPLALHCWCDASARGTSALSSKGRAGPASPEYQPDNAARSLHATAGSRVRTIPELEACGLDRNPELFDLPVAAVMDRLQYTGGDCDRSNDPVRDGFVLRHRAPVPRAAGKTEVDAATTKRRACRIRRGIASVNVRRLCRGRCQGSGCRRAPAARRRAANLRASACGAPSVSPDLRWTSKAMRAR